MEDEQKKEIKVENIKANESIVSAISYMRILDEALKRIEKHTS